MRRRLTYALTKIFTILTLLAAFGWWRSYSPPPKNLYWNRSYNLLTFTSHQGVLLIRSVRIHLLFEGPVLFLIPNGWTANFWPASTSSKFLSFAEEDPWSNTTLGFLYSKDHPGNGPPIRT